MDDLARADANDRADLFRETAAQMGGIQPLIVEKDFWVCWILSQLFRAGDALPPLVFKGGTSLSKAYALIERFSEDIDLAFDRAALGFGGDQDPGEAPSRSKAKKRLKQLDEACAATIDQQLIPWLKARIEDLGMPPDLAVDLDRFAVDFRYPPALDRSEYGHFDYISPVVQLELGARSDQQPAETRKIQPYAAEHFPGLFAKRECDVRVIAAERTFWEKATILHVEPDRPAANRATAWARLSRHAYDLYMMSQAGVAERALADPDLLRDVANHKAVFFRSAWRDYDAARPGTLRLCPTGEFEEALHADYRRMKEMFFAEPPAWSEILEELRRIESALN